MYKRFGHLALELFKLFAISVSLLLIFYITTFKTLFFLLVDSTLVNKAILEMPDVRFNIILAFVLLSVGWFISYRQKQILIVNPLKIDREEIFSFAVIAFFFSYYFSKSFAFFGSFSLLSFIILGSFFFFLFPQLTAFCSSYGYRNIQQLKKYLVVTFTRENIVSFSKNLLVVSLVLLLGGYSLFVTTYAFKRGNDYQKVLRSNVFITEISPARTTYAYKVTLKGYNLGGIPDWRYKLYSTFGPVVTDTWTDNKIEFIIPLHWKEGNVNLWIERPNRFDEQRIEVSNSVKLELINRWEFFPTQSDSIQTRAIKKLMRIMYLDYWNNLNFVLPF